MERFLHNVKEYWEEVKDQYDIDYTEFKEVCRSPFRFIKESMSSGLLKNIRIKYLGLFKVSSRRVKYSLKSLQENFDRDAISQKHYEKRKKILISLPTLFEKHEADTVLNFSYQGKTYKKIIKNDKNNK